MGSCPVLQSKINKAVATVEGVVDTARNGELLYCFAVKAKCEIRKMVFSAIGFQVTHKLTRHVYEWGVVGGSFLLQSLPCSSVICYPNN